MKSNLDDQNHDPERFSSWWCNAVLIGMNCISIKQAADKL